MQISENKVILIHYTLKTEKGEVVDSTEGREPLPYLHGYGMIVPGLETALEGKSTGESLSVCVAPKDAFGELKPELKQEIDREEFAGIEDLQIGMQFRVPDDSDQKQELIITVVDMNDKTVTVDGNHALAGQTLNFDVTIGEIRDATEEEIAHGQPHGFGGDNH